MLERLVAFDTTSRKSNLALIDFVRDYLAGFGIESRLVEQLRAVPVRPRACIIGEPTGMKPVAGHKGKTATRWGDAGPAPLPSAQRSGMISAEQADDLARTYRH